MAFAFFNRWLSQPNTPKINLVAYEEFSGPKDAEAQFSLAQRFGIASLVWLQRAVAQSCSGAESAREFVLLGMTWQEVKEGSFAASTDESAESPVVDTL